MYNKEISKVKNVFFKETIKQITPIKIDQEQRKP